MGVGSSSEGQWQLDQKLGISWWGSAMWTPLLSVRLLAA